MTLPTSSRPHTFSTTQSSTTLHVRRRQERQLHPDTSNVHHFLRFLSAWERGVRADDASRNIWRLPNATRNIVGNAE